MKPKLYKRRHFNDGSGLANHFTWTLSLGKKWRRVDDRENVLTIAEAFRILSAAW